MINEYLPSGFLIIAYCFDDIAFTGRLNCTKYILISGIKKLFTSLLKNFNTQMILYDIL